MNIDGISFSTGSFSLGGGLADADPEQKRIARKLIEYGYQPTGNKTTDKATLRRIEIQKAKESNVIRNDLLTVSKQEQEQIQEKKKQHKKDNNEPNIKNDFNGAKALGEQIYLSINMKNKNKLLPSE
ncbi:hypothetical protein J6P92_07555 [bacterium]|nr:hypothetical protein [bacterium]